MTSLANAVRDVIHTIAITRAADAKLHGLADLMRRQANARTASDALAAAFDERRDAVLKVGAAR